MFIYISSDNSNSEEFSTSYEHIREESDTVKPGISLVEIMNIVNYPNVFLLMQVVHILIGSCDVVVLVSPPMQQIY